MFYSAETNGFYSLGTHGDSRPADAVEISDELYFSCLAGQSRGLSIQPGSDGYPILTEQPPQSPEQILTSALALRDNLLTVATLRINPLQDAVDLGDATDADTVLLKKWKQYRVAVNRVRDQDSFPEMIDWPRQPE
ncbi:tail fiber assembly protein [Pseudomonas saponiphila]|uniref:tail fiber assembly protein n=1 Tax=Pseudomonas saponiphila TaxID=556534 RepID=UPI00223F61FB|nr:tail fiber assembly protein [Pseudomonas saponiphila]